jgi:hypothetical protein
MSFPRKTLRNATPGYIETFGNRNDLRLLPREFRALTLGSCL